MVVAVLLSLPLAPALNRGVEHWKKRYPVLDLPLQIFDRRVLLGRRHLAVYEAHGIVAQGRAQVAETLLCSVQVDRLAFLDQAGQGCDMA